MQPLYGRAETIAAARHWAERACAGQGRLVLFTGEPGIGKSRLAEQVMAEAASLGAAVAWGRCWEAGGAPAYWPFIQLFRSLAMNDDPFAGAVAELATAAPEARFAVYERAVRSLRTRAEQQPLAIVLDDLHAADPPSLLLLLLLARELPRSAILVIGAYRDAELRLTPEVATLLAKITREAEVVPLTRLGSADIARWLRELKGEDCSDQAAELYRLSEGHPLFVVEALRLGRGLAAQAAWARGPEAVLEERLGRLSHATRGVLESAAVLGREFVLGEVAAAAELSPDHVHAAMNEALASNIVEQDRTLERFRFSHVLFQERLYRELLPSRRAALHYRAGMTLLAHDHDAQTAVHHLLEGQSAGTPETVAEVALSAAESALSRLAFEDAVRLYRRVLSMRELASLPGLLLARLQVVAAEALIRLGESAEGKALSMVAAQSAEQAGSRELFARAALVYGTELVSGLVDDQMVGLLEKALAALEGGDSALRARLMARLCAALTPPRSAAECPSILALMRESMAMARRIGDAHTLLYCSQFAATVGLMVPERERIGLLEETLALGRMLQQPLVVLHTLPAYITALVAVGALAQAEALLPSYEELLQGVQRPVDRVRFLLVRALFLVLRGELEGAAQLASEARALAEQKTDSSRVWLMHRLCVAQLHDRPELLTSESTALLGLLELSPSAVPHAAWILAGQGRTADARALLLSTPLEQSSIPSAALSQLMGLAEACVLLEERELAARIYPLLAEAADRMFWNISPGAILGPPARALGDLALLLGRVPEAIRHYDEARAFCEKLSAPLLVALCSARRERALASAAGDLVLARQHASGSPTARKQIDQRPPLELRRDGDVWAITPRGGRTLRLKHVKGFLYLEQLVAEPGRTFHVIELAGIEHRTGDAGPVLDPRAKAAYRARLDELAAELSEAERFGDRLRVARAEQEIDAIAEQLAAAVGLGGRDRRAASDVERTRINVQRRLKDAIDRIAAADPALGRHLGAAVKTGTTCLYQPP